MIEIMGSDTVFVCFNVLHKILKTVTYWFLKIFVCENVSFRSKCLNNNFELAMYLIILVLQMDNAVLLWLENFKILLLVIKIPGRFALYV